MTRRSLQTGEEREDDRDPSHWIRRKGGGSRWAQKAAVFLVSSSPSTGSRLPRGPWAGCLFPGFPGRPWFPSYRVIGSGEPLKDTSGMRGCGLTDKGATPKVRLFGNNWGLVGNSSASPSSGAYFLQRCRFGNLSHEKEGWGNHGSWGHNTRRCALRYPSLSSTFRCQLGVFCACTGDYLPTAKPLSCWSD